MKKTINNVEYDTETAELIANYDAADNKTAAYLYRTKEGRYFLCNEKLQVRRRGAWCDHPMNGTAKGSWRFVETIKPMSEERAIDWAVETLLPECLTKPIQDRIGELVSFDLGDLAKPLARYCKDKGVTQVQVLDQAMREHLVYLQPRANQCETERAIAHLQSAIAKRFGRDFDTDSGKGTLYISHGGVSLTNPQSSIVAQCAGSIARQLSCRKAASLAG